VFALCNTKFLAMLETVKKVTVY